MDFPPGFSTMSGPADLRAAKISCGHDFIRPWFHTAMVSYGHDIAALKS
jgi:hypothetical protein